jgi:predicted GIY-YIG superfamily endonuclease
VKVSSEITDALKPFVHQRAIAPYLIDVGHPRPRSVYVEAATCKTGFAAARHVMLVHRVEAVAAVIEDGRVQYAARWLCGNGTTDAVIVAEAAGHGGLCERCIRRSERFPALYRFFDADGRLLYIGATVDVSARREQHQASAPWWPEVSEMRVERYEDISAARAAEVRAIRTEHPTYNKLLRRAAGSSRRAS